jgi:hypothetical protein
MPNDMTPIDVLSERQTTHGSFSDNARNGQRLRDMWRSSPHWASMPLEHREALDMISCKLSRILSGQSSFSDHWMDIAGYAELARKACVDVNPAWLTRETDDDAREDQ